MRLFIYVITWATEKKITYDLVQINSCPFLNFEYKNFFEGSDEAEILNPDFTIPKL